VLFQLKLKKKGNFDIVSLMKIDLQTLADLSKIELSDDELDKFQEDISKIVGFVDEIQDLTVSYESVPEDNRNVFREDTNLEDVLCNPEDLIEASAANDGRYILVNKVIDNSSK